MARSRTILKTAGTAFLGSLIGGAVVWVGQRGQFRLEPSSMSYSDLAAILLTAVAVIVTIFGGVLALAAIWGFNQLKQDAVNGAKAAGSTEVREQIVNGAIRDYILNEIGRLADEEFRSERMEARIKRRVDSVTFGKPDEDRLLDEDEGDI